MVYPWKDTLLNDTVDSIQVKYWQSFSQTHGVAFIDLFPTFFSHPNFESLFLSDEIHWNEKGHEVVFKRVWGGDLMNKRLLKL